MHCKNIAERNIRPKYIEKYTVFMDWKIKYCLDVNSLEIDLQIQAIPIKIPLDFVNPEIDKHSNIQAYSEILVFLTKKNKVGFQDK